MGSFNIYSITEEFVINEVILADYYKQLELLNDEDERYALKIDHFRNFSINESYEEKLRFNKFIEKYEEEHPQYLDPDNLGSEDLYDFPKLGDRIEEEPVKYFQNTKTEWKVIATISREQVLSLKREADYVSFSRFDSGVLPGSLYFYHKGGVVRISDHYLKQTADCDWQVKIKGSKETFEIKTKKSLYVVAYCEWEDFEVNPSF